MTEPPKNLNELLDRFCTAPVEEGAVAVGSIVEEIGARSFAPLLLFAGVILASPLSGIPGVPTTMGVLVLLISVQMLARRKHFWLPRWVLTRRVARSKIEKAVKWMRRPARFIDRFLRRRVTWIVGGPGRYLVASVCGLMALGVPLMEVVPFSATLAGCAVTAFALALLACDGALALSAFAVTAGAFAMVISRFI
jgi:hypothetical protein